MPDAANRSILDAYVVEREEIPTVRIGIGLPNTVPETNGPLMLDWARRAEERGFAFVSTIGRIGYPSFDSLTSLAAVAGATTRIGLLTNAVLGPTYPDAVLAKIALTAAHLSGERLTLGLGIGARQADYTNAERDFHRRGRAFDAQLDYLDRARRGEAVAEDRQVAPGGCDLPLLIGGHSEQAIRRVARYGAGWTGAGGGPERAAGMVEPIRTAWREAGREGEPRLLGLAYFSTGEDTAAQGDAYLREYYAFAGEHAETIARGAVRTPEAIRDEVRRFAEVGMNEVVFSPTVARLDQVDALADLVL